MQTVSCPSCGAPVQFRSHASVMAVCEYCRAAVIKNADAVKDMGKISAVLEDYSPIQVGTAGVFRGLNFTVAGRIQLRYAQGIWNEWYLLFDDASTGWLGDSSGQYVITRPREAAPPLPDFHDIRPARMFKVGDQTLMASERREAECIGGQGELPFRVGDGWSIRVADLRSGVHFVTLDYTEGAVPTVYVGEAVTLEQLKCQLLRDDDQIKSSAGKYRAKLDTLDCPSCGSKINYVPGMTSNLVCPGCASQLDASGPEATVLAAGEAVENVFNTLPLGAVATIGGARYTVIGAMLRVDEEDTEWTEYLLYSMRNGFFWLVETDQGWFRAGVLSTWPQLTSLEAASVMLDKVSCAKLYDYDATVRYAAGAFNWRVAAGDVVRVYEFEGDQASLSAELTLDELTWSRSTPVAHDQLKAWFGAQFKGQPVLTKAATASLSATQKQFVWWILGLNAIPMLFGGTIFLTIFALIALYLPAGFFQKSNDQ